MIWKRYLIRLLLRLIDIDDKPLEDDKFLRQWLAANWQDKGFQEYIKRRDRLFLRELSGGVGMSARTHDDYVQIIGQRFELLRFADRCKKMFEEEKKKK